MDECCARLSQACRAKECGADDVESEAPSLCSSISSSSDTCGRCTCVRRELTADRFVFVGRPVLADGDADGCVHVDE